MTEYKFRVIETRTVACDYIVEAASKKKAERLAEAGDTTFEFCHEETMEVVDRTVEFCLED